MRRLAVRLYALRACADGVLLYPVYALLFADSGVTAAQVSTLFAIWSLTSFVLEIPSGAWADAFSRRGLLVLSGLLRAAGFALWILWPSYPAFAAGFVLWGVAGALESGTEQALVYDELAVLGATDRYATIMGRGEMVSLLAWLAATALAAPAFALGGYPLVGAASVAISLAQAGVALSLPETPRAATAADGTATAAAADGDGDGAATDSEDGTDGADGTDGGGVRRYLRTLGAGLAEVRGQPRVRRAVALAATVPALTALDEYLPLLARAMGTSTVLVPLLLLLPTAAMAAAGGLAGRWAGASARGVAVALAAGALLLAAGALAPHPAGMLAVAGFFAVMQVAMVVTDARLQDSITGRSRATVTSVAGFGSELVAMGIFAGFALGAGLGVPALMALCAGPLLLLALLTARWLPPRLLPPRPQKGSPLTL